MNGIGTPPTDVVALLHDLCALVLVASLLAFLVGVTLASRNVRAMRAMNSMNHWISLRKALKVAMVPHGVSAASLERPTILGIFVLLGAAISVYVLSGIDTSAFREILFPAGSGAIAAASAGWIKWILLVGNGACIVVGLLMVGSPEIWRRIERQADKWYSLRKATLPLDKMHTEFDGWVLTHPTVSGIALIVVSLGLGVAAIATSAGLS